MFLKNCLQQWDNVTGVTGYDITTIYEQLLTDVGSPFLYQNAQQKGLLSLRICIRFIPNVLSHAFWGSLIYSALSGMISVY